MDTVDDQIVIAKDISVRQIIGASLSEPHHVRSTVKFVFLLACLLVCMYVCMYVCLSPPYMVECNQKYIKSHLSVNHAC